MPIGCVQVKHSEEDLLHVQRANAALKADRVSAVLCRTWAPLLGPKSSTYALCLGKTKQCLAKLQISRVACPEASQRVSLPSGNSARLPA